MTKAVFLTCLAAMWAPLPAIAQSIFDGDWKTDISSLRIPKPQAYLLQNGVYICRTCAPAITIEADGASHPVSDHPYFDAMAIKVIDPHTVQETLGKAGKIVATSTLTIAPDGNTLTIAFSDGSDSNGTPVTGNATATRVAPAPSGAHALSGSWRMCKFGDFSRNGLLVTYNVTKDMLHMSMATGQSFTAKLDGAEAPYAGDPGITSVSIIKIGGRALQETDKRDGKTIGIGRITLGPGGSTIRVVYVDKIAGTTTSMIARKQ